MPNTMTAQQEQELYSNAYKLGHVFVKSIRYDRKDFWADFLVGVLEDKYVKLGMPLDKIRVPLRKCEPKDFKVTNEGAVKTDNYQQYTPEEKQGFSKKQSVSVVSIAKEYYPPVFGHDKDRYEELVGVMFFFDKIEKNSKSSHVLPSIIMSYDGGTVGRPYHFDLLEKAEEYFTSKTQEKIWHDSVQSLIDADKISNKNLERHNEVLARLKWTGESKCQIGIFADNLKSRLIAQLRAIDVKNNTGQEFVPISFYIFNKESKEKIYPYYLKDQAKDLELALNDTSLTDNAAELKAIALYIYFLKLSNNNQQAYECLTNIFNSPGFECYFEELLFYIGRKKITEISRKIVLNNIRETIYRNKQDIADVYCKKQEKWLLLIAIDLDDVSDINDLVEFEDEFCNNALHLAVHWRKLNLIKRLLDCLKFGFNKVNGGKTTPLWWAVNARDIETVKLLLTSKNVDCNQGIAMDSTPLLRAIESGDVKMVELLLSQPNIDINKADESLGRTPFWRAIRSNNESIMNLVLFNKNIDWNKVDQNGATLILQVLCSDVSIKTIKLLLLSNLKIDWRANYVLDMLLFRAIREDEPEIVKNLLLSDPAIDWNKVDNYGRTPLFNAVIFAKIEIVKLLMSIKDIDWNKADNHGKTPLVAAVECGNVAMVEFLLNKVNFNTDNNSVAPLELINSLIDTATISLKDHQEHFQSMMALLVNEYNNQQENNNNLQPKSPTLKPKM